MVGKLTTRGILNLLGLELARRKISSSTPTLVPKGKVGWGEVASLWIGVNHDYYYSFIGKDVSQMQKKI